MLAELITPEMLIAILGIIIGVSIRTLLPYFQKLQEQPNLAFSWRYVGAAVISALLTAIIILPYFNYSELSSDKILISAIVFAFTADELLTSYMKGKGTTTVKIATKTDRIENKIKKLQSQLATEKKVDEKIAAHYVNNEKKP